MKVAILPPINEPSTMIITRELLSALRTSRPKTVDFRVVHPPNIRIPRSLLNILPNTSIHGHINAYFSRFVLYPPLVAATSANVYHITDNRYAHLCNWAPKGHSIVTWNHGTPKVMREHFKVPESFHLRTIEHLLDCALNASFILTPTDSARHELIDHYPIDPNRVIVAPYGVNNIFHPRTNEQTKIRRREAGLQDDVFVLLHVGATAPSKNVEAILAAMPLLPSDIHLVQIGGAPTETHRLLIDSGRIAHRVHYLGFVDFRLDRERLAEWYCAADTFIFPSFYEGFGLPILEAMASGTPVITSESGATAEVADGAAKLVNPKSLESVATAIRELYASSEERRNWRDLGQVHAAKYTWTSCASTALELYKRVDAGDQRPVRK